MLISSPCVVSLVWTLADGQGQTLDELTDPVEFFFGGDDLLPKLEEALAGHAAGYEIDLHLEPEHAFGEYDPALVCFEERAVFPEGIETGMQFDGLPDGAQTVGMPTDRVYTITEVYPDHVVLDGNHPLAGVALRLAVTVSAVRAATEDERASRSVGESPLRVADVAPPPAYLH